MPVVPLSIVTASLCSLKFVDLFKIKRKYFYILTIYRILYCRNVDRCYNKSHKIVYEIRYTKYEMQNAIEVRRLL